MELKSKVDIVKIVYCLVNGNNFLLNQSITGFRHNIGKRLINHILSSNVENNNNYSYGKVYLTASILTYSVEYDALVENFLDTPTFLVEEVIRTNKLPFDMDKLLESSYQNKPKIKLEKYIETNDIEKIYNVERVEK